MYRESSGIREVAGYILSDRLGSGGMGDVYKAYHPGLQRYAAVKILHQKEMAERFRNEAFIQASVNHPNIARLYESSLNGPTPSIVMEYVEGESLDHFIRRRGKMSNEAALNILQQVSSALAYLHSKDILHRDIKPSNFKIRQDGTVMMLDFGIAKHKYSPKLTQQGFIVGTTEYMAPEQFRQEVEKQSDIWSLGVMMYEMLTGHLPFESANPLVLQGKILRASFTDPQILASQISPVLHTVIEKCLRVNPSGRITAAGLKKLVAGEGAVMQTKWPNIELLGWSLNSFLRSAFSSPAGPSPDQSGQTGLSLSSSSHSSGHAVSGSSFQSATNLPWYKRVPVIITGIMALAILIMVVLINIDPVVIPASDPATGDQAIQPAENKPAVKLAGDVYRIRINTPSVENASAVFADGQTRGLPTEVSGRDGERLEFLIRANGYEDKKVSLGINSRREAYDYNLEKIK